MQPLLRRTITATLLLSSVAMFSFAQLYPQSALNKTIANGAMVAPFFIANKGQVADNVQFYVKGDQHSFFLKASGEAVTRSFYKQEGAEKSGSSLLGADTAQAQTVREIGFSQIFVGANQGVVPKAGERAAATLNFFTDKVQAKGVPTYNSLTYGNLYDGIDLTYRVSEEKKVKYDLVVGAGVDPRKIVMQFDGVQDLSLDGDGNLVMKTPVQTFTQNKPYIYQMVRGVEREVEGSYEVGENHTVGFSLGKYDSSLPLVIDPVLDQLGASTLYGAADADSVNGLTRNSSDQIYVTGSTYDTNPDLPVIGGAYDNSHAGSYDTFVARFDNDLASLTYATYIGGSLSDLSRDIALDTNGKVVIVGSTASGSGYPTSVAPYSSTDAIDAFISRFSADLSNLEVSARFGGSDTDVASALYIDSSNYIYVAGYTISTGFPGLTGNYGTSNSGGSDVFVAKLPNDLSSIDATYLGGSELDQISGTTGLVVDSSGNIYVGGITASTNFPTAGSPAYDTSHNGGYDGFISKFPSTLASLSASTYIGTSGTDQVSDLALDSSGALYAGVQAGGSGLETTASVLQTAAGGGYIAKFPSSLATLSIGTYFGGTDTNTFINRLVLDSSNVVYVAGHAGSSFTTASGAYDTSFNSGTYDGFVSKITANLQALSESTYIGGSGDDYVYALGLGVDEVNLLIAGSTADSTTDFPTTAGAYDTGHNGSNDAFISILGEVSGGQGGGGGGVPEFSTYVYLATLLWCGYLLRRKFYSYEV